MKSSILQVVIGIIIITIIHFGEVAHATSDSANFVDTVLNETTQSQLARKRYWNFYTRNELEEIWNVSIKPESRFDCSIDDILMLHDYVYIQGFWGDKPLFGYSQEELLPTATRSLRLEARALMPEIEADLFRKGAKLRRQKMLAMEEEFLDTLRQVDYRNQQMFNMGQDPNVTLRLRRVRALHQELDQLNPTEQFQLKCFHERVEDARELVDLEEKFFKTMCSANDVERAENFIKVANRIKNLLTQMEALSEQGMLSDENTRPFLEVTSMAERSFVAFDKQIASVKPNLRPLQWLISSEKKFVEIFRYDSNIKAKKAAIWAEVQSEVKNNSNDAFQHMLDVNSKSNEAVCGRCNRTYYRSSAGCPQCDGANYGLKSFLYQENKDRPEKTRVFY